MLAHPALAECAVVGVPDDIYGQKIGASLALLDRRGPPLTLSVVSFTSGSSATLEELRVFCSSQLAKYQLPSVLKVVDTIPKNAMGKVNKKALVSVFSS
jgi:malonyl-CoA/methylmalonyl-CoA synthetase